MPTGHPAQSHGRTIVLVLSARLSFSEGDVVRARQLGQDAFARGQYSIAAGYMEKAAPMGQVRAQAAGGENSTASRFCLTWRRFLPKPDPSAVGGTA